MSMRNCEIKLPIHNVCWFHHNAASLCIGQLFLPKCFINYLSWQEAKLVTHSFMLLFVLGFGCQKKVKFTAKDVDSSTSCRLEVSPLPLERKEVTTCEFCYLIPSFSLEMHIVLIIHRFEMLLLYIFSSLLELNYLKFMFN